MNQGIAVGRKQEAAQRHERRESDQNPNERDRADSPLVLLETSARPIHRAEVPLQVSEEIGVKQTVRIMSESARKKKGTISIPKPDEHDPFCRTSEVW